jgi:hypothetical protein
MCQKKREFIYSNINGRKIIKREYIHFSSGYISQYESAFTSLNTNNLLYSIKEAGNARLLEAFCESRSTNCKDCYITNE